MHGKEYLCPLHLGEVAIEKSAFGSPLTMIDQLTYMRINIIERLMSMAA